MHVAPTRTLRVQVPMSVPVCQERVVSVHRGGKLTCGVIVVAVLVHVTVILEIIGRHHVRAAQCMLLLAAPTPASARDTRAPCAAGPAAG